MGHIICRTIYGLYDIVNFQDQYLLSTVSCSIYFSDNIRLILVDLFWSCQTGVKFKETEFIVYLVQTLHGPLSHPKGVLRMTYYVKFNYFCSILIPQFETCIKPWFTTDYKISLFETKV